ncbi:hypothetical protein MVES1_001242 [Malassezia vespertilionis]|nr:uncharacterized protein MVES1_001242 [Malassezia vespertilionis]WFD05908.1 hypothetical protein MVES1_001242 [Malassezia vespertilionis]
MVRPTEYDAYILAIYKHFQGVGVAQDGIADGTEHTLHRAGPPVWDAPAAPRIPTLQQDCATDCARYASLDRYGFFAYPGTGVQKEPQLLPTAGFKHRRLLRRASYTLPTPEALLASRAQWEARAKKDEVKRCAKWAHMISMHDGTCTLHAAPKLVRGRVYKGIPDAWRSAAWRAMAKMPHADSAVQTAFETVSAYDTQIDLDIPRTARGHIRFHTRYGRGQCDMFAVLHAASVQNEVCGYCQGMGSVVAVLLLYMIPEEAFAMLQCLLDTFGFRRLYEPGFPGLREELFVLNTLLAQLAPRTTKQLAALGVAPSAYATRWYMTLFTNVLPFPTQLRVWDAVLLDGLDVITLVACALVQTLERYYSTCAPDALFELLNAPVYVESDDALLQWVHNALDAAPVRATIKGARHAWVSHESQGTSDALFL